MNHHWKELLPVDRYIVRSSSILHDYDRKILTLLYQPLIGSRCFSLYMTMWGELEQNRIWGEETTHHSLMAIMQSNLKEILEERVKLEGIGLLKTYVKHEDDTRLFVYELQPPLAPHQFFTDGVLNIYLYSRLGKNKFNQLKKFFSDSELALEEFTPITRAFNEVYDSVHPSTMVKHMSDEAEQNLEPAMGQEWMERENSVPLAIKDDVFNFDLFFAGLSEVLIPKKAITPRVKEVIKKLSYLYGIDALQMKNLVISSIGNDDSVNIDELRKAARDWYQFEQGDELPSLAERVHPAIHRTMENRKPATQEELLIARLETMSPRQLLIDISGGAEPSISDLQVVEEVMFKQKLLPGVVNVLIYYVMLRTDMKLTKGYVEKIASHWVRKDIKTVKEAMELAKQEHRQYQKWAESKNTKSSKAPKKQPIRTEMLPDWLNEESAPEPDKTVSATVDSDFEAEKRKLEERIKNYKKNSN